MKKSVEYRSSGIGFLGMLTILFIGLKLTGYIDWSWWLVLLPAYWPIAAVIVIATAVLLIKAFAK